MSLGILGAKTKQRRPISGLGGGALGATIPWQCWDVPGFKDCQAQVFEEAKKRCANGSSLFSGQNDCVTKEHNDLTYYGCATRLCPDQTKVTAPKTIGGWQMGNTTPNAEVKQLQSALNQVLAAAGFKAISVDGKLGPATCGAFKYIGTLGLSADLVSILGAGFPYENLAVCSAWTNPTAVGTSKPVVEPVDPFAKELDKQFGGGSVPWGQEDARVATLQDQLNVQLRAHNMLPIGVDGKLGPATCGAMRWLDKTDGSTWMQNWGQNCSGYSDPAAGAPIIVATGPEDELPPELPPPPEVGAGSGAKFSAATMLAGLGIVAAGGAVLYTVGKRKGWFK